MAELADAGGLNPPEGNFLRVRFPLRALFIFAVAQCAQIVLHVQKLCDQYGHQQWQQQHRDDQRMIGFNPPRDVMANAVGEAHIKHGDINLSFVLREVFQTGIHASCGGNNLDVALFLKNTAKGIAHHVVIITQQDPNRHAGMVGGI